MYTIKRSSVPRIYPNAHNLPPFIITGTGQKFWEGTAYHFFPAGCCCSDRSGSCEWCRVYYHGPEEM